MIAEQLRGKRLAITGTTGFVGTALVERLLRCVPDCDLVLIVRPGRRGAERRIERDVLRNDAFDRLRADLGRDGFDEMTARRVHAVAGDVAVDGLALDDAARELLASCDVVIHSAASVAFDSALDDAVEINLLGPVRMARTLLDLGVNPHMVSVSTCYVAGSRRGSAPEVLLENSPFFIDVDWQREVDFARRARDHVEADSRSAERLDEFRSKARQELGAAGTPALAVKTEQLREKWVSSEMVRAGVARAESLGFPDAYAFTKALGERALTQGRGDIPVTIVRPSIIESAWQEPKPGWIRGFRMAEPMIINYAKGLLSEFPGVPEGIVDVIPVDQVVAAIIAAAAEGSDPNGEPAVIQVASGSVNPLRYEELVGWCREYFAEKPLYDEKNQPIAVPEFGFPGRGRVQSQLERALKGLELVERTMHRVPMRGKPAMLTADIEERREQVERAMGYVDLYGAYAECEALYGVDRLLAMWDRLAPEDKASFGFDPRVFDWHTYLSAVHLPSIVEQARVRTEPSGRSAPSRSERLRDRILSPDRQMAVFDLENTLIASNVVASYSWLATRRLGDEDRVRLAARTIAEAPKLLGLDRRDRSDFLRYFYRRYKHAPVDQIADDSREMFSDLILTKSFPAAIRRVREHRALGHRTVLITGALDFVVEPLQPLFDDILSATMATDGDVYTGQMDSVPPTGETRASILRHYAEDHGISLSESIAYADSTSDLPMLEIVGFPVAVNPETRLASLARRRGWLVENFAKAPGGPRKIVPIGPRRSA